MNRLEDVIKTELQPYKHKLCRITVFIRNVGEIMFDLCSIECDYQFFNYIFVQTIDDETIGFNAFAVQKIESLKNGGHCISFNNEIKLHIEEYTLDDLERILNKELAKLEVEKRLLNDKLRAVKAGSLNVGNKVMYRININGGYIIT